jgi:arginine-tRNA-protein transferase
MFPDPPVQIHLTVLPEVDCPYLPGRRERLRAVMASAIDGQTYRAFMDAGFRRSGRMLYQPVCEGCEECVPLRVEVGQFTMSDSQKRVWRRNQDLVVTSGVPRLTEEKFDLYSRYVRDWHGRPEEARWDSLESFLYDSPTETIEFEYRDTTSTLRAVGICDLSRTSLSSVYFYFDPAEAKRSLGTFGALYELAWARERHLNHYYLGYWIRDCPTMAYKASFKPYETLGPGGAWIVNP